MMNSIWCVVLLCLTFDRTVNGQTGKFDRIHEGDACTVDGQTGRWTDFMWCKTSNTLLNIAPRLLSQLDDDEIMVCCYLRHIIKNCEPGRQVFEVTRFDSIDSDKQQPHTIVLSQRCTPPQEGDTCETDNGAGGRWTLDKDCPINGENRYAAAGCCKTQSISEQKCREYSKHLTKTIDNCSAENSVDGNTVPPYMAKIINGNTLTMCIGTIVSPLFVLFPAGFSHGVVGIEAVTVASEIHSIAAIIEHPDYVKGQFNNDIALARLESPLHFNDQLRPACLPAKHETRQNRGILAGYSVYTNGLLKIMPTIQTQYECCKNYDPPANYCLRNSSLIGSAEVRHLCAKSKPHDGNICQFAYGSSIYLTNENVDCTVTVHAMSVLNGQDTPCTSKLFLRIYDFTDWIQATIGQYEMPAK